MKDYEPDRIKKVKINKESYILELYYKTNSYIQDKKNEILNIMEDLTIDAWGNPSSLTTKWFELLDVFVIAKQKDRIYGFAVGNYMDFDLVLFVASMVRKDKQSLGIGSYINAMIIKNLFYKKFFSLKGLLNLFKPVYFVFRTPNPILYAMVYKKYNIFPSIQRSRPTKKEKFIFNEVVRRFSPSANIDRENFIIKGAYLNYPELIYDLNNIPWSNDEKINKFLDKTIKLTKREGNTMVIVGKVSVFDFIKQII